MPLGMRVMGCRPGVVVGSVVSVGSSGASVSVGIFVGLGVLVGGRGVGLGVGVKVCVGEGEVPGGVRGVGSGLWP